MAETSAAPPPARSETSDVNIRAIVLTAAALAAIVLACAAALLGLRAWLARDHAQTAGPFTDARALEQFASPRLEAAPTRDIAAFDREKAAKLERYRWIDRSPSVVQIPIARAIEIMSSRSNR